MWLKLMLTSDHGLNFLETVKDVFLTNVDLLNFKNCPFYATSLGLLKNNLVTLSYKFVCYTVLSLSTAYENKL